MDSKLAIKYCDAELSVTEAHDIFTELKNKGSHLLACETGIAFALEFSQNIPLMNDVTHSLFQLGMLEEAYDVYVKTLSSRELSERDANVALFNQHFSINTVSNRYIEYNSEIVNRVTSQLSKRIDSPHIVFTITTCKRLDLFQVTMNSFLNCCIDCNKIDEWICVDDNSSEEDRDEMMKKYPFFTFVWKSKEDKGHAQSMNIIRDRVIESGAQYSLHMEDDWKFFDKRPYITQAIEVLESDEKIGQCLFNKNYAETEIDIAICGGDFHTTGEGFRYYVHEMVENEEQRIQWENKHFDGTRRPVHCNYWPHYSLRPSVIKTDVYKKVGRFEENTGHFEMEYAYRYFKEHGYTSAFFEGIYCEHTGRLTSQRLDDTKKNAYNLNDESQFVKKKNCEEINEGEEKKKWNSFINLHTAVVNLSHREDRWKDFTENAKEIEFLKYERFDAVNGEKCEPNLWLQRLFDGNDYNMRVGLVGCAMSHIKLYVELLNSDCDAYLILEDDLKFVPNFEKKFICLVEQFMNFEGDMVYLGHHLRNDASEEEKNEAYDTESMPRIEKWSTSMSFSRSLGGTGGYLITRRGAERLLDFIDRNGMTNGIDTVQQKAADELDIFYSIPHLYYSDCWRGNNQIDTDIQHNYKSLTMPVELRVNAELEYYGDVLKMEELDLFTIESHKPILYTGKDVEHLKEILKNMSDSYRWFCLDNCTMFIIPLSMTPSRLKNEKGEWHVSSSI